MKPEKIVQDNQPFMQDWQNSSLLQPYLPEKDEYTNIPQRLTQPLLLLLVFSFLLINFIEAAQPAGESDLLSGILCEVQVLISIYLTMKFAHLGYMLALVLNCLSLVLTTHAVFSKGISNAVIGLIVYLFTIISIKIIDMLVTRNIRQFEKVCRQNTEITALYEELAASEEELRVHNEQLTEYNRIIKKNEEKLHYLAHFDTLTELPNRQMLMERLEILIRQSLAENFSFAIVFIDLDNFKKINDTLGHNSGDILIRLVSSRLRTVTFNSDILGRLGGDEFALIIQQSMDKVNLLKYIECLRKTLEEPFSIEKNTVHITASFGIAIYPQDGDSPIDLLKSADTAMYQAKDSGKNSSRFFRPEMLDVILAKIEFEDMLRDAVKNRELYLVFQPQFHTVSQSIRGFEVLLRWQSPRLGAVSPAKFIPLAEENGMIISIGEWILRTACQTFQQLQEKYKLSSMFSVNISAVQIEEPSFIDLVKTILDEYRLPPSCLEIEITETVFIKSMDHAVYVLNSLKAMGIKIALDDFGTGYSSLRYLQMLPIDTLKIDKSFIDHISHQDETKQIVGSIISLVHRLGMQVVAEGVETEEQKAYLTLQECDYIQGFLLGKPIDKQSLEKLTAAL